MGFFSFNLTNDLCSSKYKKLYYIKINKKINFQNTDFSQIKKKIIFAK